MRRFSLLAVVTAASLLGVLAIGSSTASAAVLCKKSSANNYCGYENFYPKETTVHANLAAGTNFNMSTGTGGSFWFSCSSSAIDMTTKNVGGLEEVVDTTTNEFALSGCTKAVSVVSWNWGYFNWTAEKGGVASVFATIQAVSPWSPSATCRYQVAGEGKVVGGNQLVYSEAQAYEVPGNNFLCPKKPIFSATYNITTPTPLYVEKY